MRIVGGLRSRLVAAFTAVALLASVGASGISYVLIRKTMLQRVQDAEVTFVRQTAARLVPDALPPDTGPAVAETLTTALRTEDGRRRAWAAPVNHSGPWLTLLPGPNALHVPVTKDFAQRVHGNGWDRWQTVFQRIVKGGRPYLLIGGITGLSDYEPRAEPILVFVSVSLRQVADDLGSFTRSILIADATTLAAALVLALLASRGVLRPVRRLGRAARALGEGDLDTRVEVEGGDELADLARTFNRTAEALERMVAQLRAKDTASRRFVADVSHELRTPLTSMIAATEILAEETPGEGDGGTAARLVAEETRRLSVLTEHLIEISRFDAGAAALVTDDVVVADAVTATLDARGWTALVEVAGPAGLVVAVDPRRFDVIVANLAGNALRHGRPPVRLVFGPAARDGRDGLRLTVTDHGPGIPEDVLPAIFDRFVKAEAARSRSEGSGLGLSIARENALLHGGTLDAANGAGGGAVFTLWLPASRPDGTGHGTADGTGEVR